MILTTLLLKDRVALSTRGESGGRGGRHPARRRVVRVRAGRVIGALVLSSTATTGFAPICRGCLGRLHRYHVVGRGPETRGTRKASTASGGSTPQPMVASRRVTAVLEGRFIRDHGVLSVHRGCCGRFDGVLSRGRVVGVCRRRGDGVGGFEGRFSHEGNRGPKRKRRRKREPHTPHRKWR